MPRKSKNRVVEPVQEHVLEEIKVEIPPEKPIATDHSENPTATTTFPFEVEKIKTEADWTKGRLLEMTLNHILKTVCPGQPDVFYELRREVSVDIFIRLMVLSCRQLDFYESSSEQERFAIVKLLFLLAGVNFEDWYSVESKRTNAPGKSSIVYTKTFVDDVLLKHSKKY